ncbi:MAG: Sua5/YciO/YrdC/YwlC family protein [Patescibacteria group bacterium]
MQTINKQWIMQHHVPLDMLPGPVTLIVEPKHPAVFPKEINPNGSSIGVRIPEHWFSEVIASAGVPFITTSVNLTDQPHMISIEDIPTSFYEVVSFCVYEGPIHGVSSKKIDLTKNL